ncbi:unnamed protein product [Clonostachys rosea]|uniref:Uncharacterized protein n=1 Tax=Bionectria ochroleuca TaxID=29856 RepID=A0ABY6USG0_BIOOC|nr:unnamed protein product [Clonostachys rosea]
MAQSRPDTSWHFVGQASAFPNVTSDKASSLTETYPCGGGRESEQDSSATGCKVFFVSDEKDSDATPVDLNDPIKAVELKNQVLIFQYNGKFHAVDHSALSTLAYDAYNRAMLEMPPFLIPTIRRGTL